MDAFERYFFDLNGYLVIEDVLTADELAAAGRAIDARQLPQPAPEEGSPRFHGFLTWEEPVFRRLIDHPRIVPYLKEIIGEGFRLDHEYGIYMRRSAAGLGLHGGGTPFDPSEYYHVHGDHMYNGLIVVSWALADAPAGAGGFCCIPASHKQNWRQPPHAGGFAPESILRQVPQAARSVLIFTEALRHGTLPWTADHERRSVLYKYCPGHMAWGNRRNSPEFLAMLTDNQRRVVEPPYVWRRQPIEVPGADSGGR